MQPSQGVATLHPRNVVFVLLDSVNRLVLGGWGGTNPARAGGPARFAPTHE
jgi:hypothetical protein